MQRQKSYIVIKTAGPIGLITNMAAKLMMQMHFAALNIAIKMPLLRVLMLFQLHINLGLLVGVLVNNLREKEMEQNMDIMDFQFSTMTMILRILMVKAMLLPM